MARIFQDVSSETPRRRTYFYTGGQYVEDESGQQVLRDQMYVEQLDPIDGPRYPVPIVLIHGKGQTGTVSNFQSSSYPTLINFWN